VNDAVGHLFPTTSTLAVFVPVTPAVIIAVSVTE
jgi:hypothetical protein